MKIDGQICIWGTLQDSIPSNKVVELFCGGEVDESKDRPVWLKEVDANLSVVVVLILPTTGSIPCWCPGSVHPNKWRLFFDWSFKMLLVSRRTHKYKFGTHLQGDVGT